jgi:CAAX protease family protein
LVAKAAGEHENRMKMAVDRNSGFRLAILIEGALAALAVLLGWAFRVPLRDQFGQSFREIGQGTLWGVLAMLPLLVMFWWLIHATWPAARRLREQVEQLILELFPEHSIPQMIAVSVMAGIGEELLFRGVLQTLAARWTTPLLGIAVSSLIFGMFHTMSPLYFFLATVVGAYFGWIVLAGQDLVPAIVGHVLYDCFALVYLSRAYSARQRLTRPLLETEDE